jgi:hypothetical protein
LLAAADEADQGLHSARVCGALLGACAGVADLVQRLSCAAQHSRVLLAAADEAHQSLHSARVESTLLDACAGAVADAAQSLSCAAQHSRVLVGAVDEAHQGLHCARVCGALLPAVVRYAGDVCERTSCLSCAAAAAKMADQRADVSGLFRPHDRFHRVLHGRTKLRYGPPVTASKPTER